MKTIVNPGSRLELVGSFDVTKTTVVDRESGKEVTLAGLLRSFMYDPEEGVTGKVHIVIEPGYMTASDWLATLG